MVRTSLPRLASVLAFCAWSIPAIASDCAKTTVGLIPINDLGPLTYQGFSGGLYPNGQNSRPPAHDAAGLQSAAQVLPRDASGQPASDGSIVVISIGMSNATMEFSSFVQLANADPAMDPSVVLVDAAQGGQTAAAISDPNSPYWSFVDQRLAQANQSAAQVQVIWLKEANAAPAGGFPAHAQELRSQLVSILHILRDKFENARLCYLASRIYAGYATSSLNPEPVAYEQAFAVKWLIEAQIAGDPALAYSAAQGPVRSPWLAWGTYNWADGIDARSDGLSWDCADFNSDGTHPSVSGRAKVAQALLDFMKTDATTRSWFLAAATPTCGVPAMASNFGTAFGGGNGVSRLVASDPPILGGTKGVHVHAWSAPPAAACAFLFGLTKLSPGAAPFHGGSLLVSPLVVVPAFTNGFGKSTLPLGPIPGDPALCGFHAYFQFVAIDAGSVTGFDVSSGLDLRLGH